MTKLNPSSKPSFRETSPAAKSEEKRLFSQATQLFAFYFLSQVVSYLSCFFISLSIAAFCVSTLPGIREEKKGQIMGNQQGLAALEIVCSSFFTLEFLIRVTFCPKKIEFIKKPMNWIDLISILPFYVAYFYDANMVKMFLVIRVLRLFRYGLSPSKGVFERRTLT